MPSTARGVSLGFDSIVVATDFTEFADRALLKTVELARGSSSKIILAHVIDPLIYATALNGAPFVPRLAAQEARERLESSAYVLRRERIPYELVVREGILRKCLCQLVEDRKADLLVVATHGDDRFNRAVCGSMAEKILRVAPCPVMTVGPLAFPARRTGRSPLAFLFATNFSAHSLRTLPFADALAHRLGAELHLLHVAPPAADRPDVARQLMQKLEQMARTHALLTSRVNCLVERGELGETVAAVASSIDAVAVVLSVQTEDLRRKPSGGLNQGLIYRILTHSTCPVITVHSGVDRQSLQARILEDVLVTA